tara:strand:- start:523 stop:717 length:195 start_codon:yes stop_codon:yes gene_type:complete
VYVGTGLPPIPAISKNTVADDVVAGEMSSGTVGALEGGAGVGPGAGLSPVVIGSDRVDISDCLT